MSLDSFQTRATLKVGADTVEYFSLPALEAKLGPAVGRLPYSLKILLENLLRREDNAFVKAPDITALGTWTPGTSLMMFRTVPVSFATWPMWTRPMQPSNRT